MKIFLLILSGICGGVIGGMGMGGGTLLIPILTIFWGMEQHLAQAINLISFIPMSIVCLIIHFKNKLLKIKKVWWVALIAVVGAIGGSILCAKISAKILSKILGGFLVLLALFQFAMFLKQKNKKE